MLSAVYVECHFSALYAECRYAEYRYPECRYTECRGTHLTSENSKVPIATYTEPKNAINKFVNSSTQQQSLFLIFCLRMKQ